ncbi:MAG: PDDEXK nuclease domain-containing protein [Paludibacteraceae bacterium]|nr:PDDEXK nuclease domain-containing protein [Paludibacteraceae bacterium]
MNKDTNIHNDLFERIAALITEARRQTVRMIDTAMVCTYYEIGRYIVEDEQDGKARAEYGKAVLKDLSKRLTARFGRGFSVDNLQNMRNFYTEYAPVLQTSSEKYETPSRKSPVIKYETPSRKSPAKVSPEYRFTLSWSHYLKLMRIKDPQERRFYEIEARENHWSLKELERQFDASLYERLSLSRDKEGIMQLAQKGQIVEKPEDLIKDPLILEFTGLPALPRYSEKRLEQHLIDNLQNFMLELGKGFAFVGRQVRLSFGEEHYFVDLVFYNRYLQSFVLIDLKRGKLKHQDIGQMQMYVNYYDREMRLPHENPTIGILLCRDKSDAVVEYTLPQDNNQIFASQYQTILPSKEELKKLIQNK